MLHELHLKNFKRHRDTLLQFPQGLTCLVGGNGAGKSTILRAIVFCLYGPGAAGKREHLGTWGTGDQPECDLTLTLPIHGKVVVTRSLTKATVTQGEAILASGHTPVSKFVEDALGMTATVFKLLLYSRQGDAQALLKMGPAGLQKHLETIARVDILDRVLEALSADAQADKKALSVLGEPPELDVLEATVARIESELADKCKEEAQLAEVIKETAAEESALQSKAAQLAAQTTELGHLRRKRQDIADALNKAQQELDALPTLQGIEDLDAAIAQQAELRQAHTQVATDLSAAYAKANRLTTSVEALEKATQRLSFLHSQEAGVKAWRVLTEAEQAAKEALALAKAEWRRLGDASKIVDICQTCGRPFGTTDEERAHYQEMVRSQEAELKAAKETHDMRLKALTAAEDKTRALRGTLSLSAQELSAFDILVSQAEELAGRYTTEIDALVDEVGGKQQGSVAEARSYLSSVVRELEGKKEKLADESDLLETLIRKATQTQGRRSHLLEMQAAYTANLEELKLRIADFGFDLEETAKEVGRALADTTAQLQAHRLAHVQVVAEIKLCQSQVTLASKDLQAAKDTVAKTHQLEQDLSTRQTLINYLRTNRAKFLEDTWTTVTQCADSLLGAVTEGGMGGLTRTDSGEFTVDEEAAGVPLDELAGSRQSIVGLCLRIALAQVFHGEQGFLLLDEVTADCSDENAARVAGMLQAVGTQTLMVTHRQGDAVNADNIIAL